MKRNLLFFSLFVICISACSANEKGLFSRFIKNEGNDIKISKEEKERIGQIDEIEHNQILSISVQKIEVHSRPFSFKQDNVIYISKPGDEIKIKNVLYSKKFGTSCLYVTFPDNKKGFIPMKSNPYIISRKSGQKIQKIANLQYYKSKANYGTKKKGISR